MILLSQARACPVTSSALTTTPALLSGKFDVGMADTVVTGECICTAECLLVGAEVTSHLLLTCVVNRILMPCQVVGPGEDGIARLARARVDAVATVWSCLAVQQAGSHASVADFWPP